MSRLPLVVGVKKCDIFALRKSDAAVACGADAGVLLSDDVYRRDLMCCGIAAHHIGAAVGRTVVDHNHLAVAEILHCNRAESPLYESPFVIQRYYNRYHK